MPPRAPDERGSLPPPPEPMFSAPVKLRAKHRVLVGPHVYEPGQTFECDARNAEWLVADNYAEVA